MESHYVDCMHFFFYRWLFFFYRWLFLFLKFQKYLAPDAGKPKEFLIRIHERRWNKG